MIKNNKIVKEVMVYLAIIAIGAILALSYELFVVPNDFSPAGLNGIAVMVQYKMGFSIGYMSFLINLPMCIFAYFFIDKGFAVKTLVFCVAYSVFYQIFTAIPGIKQFQYAAGLDKEQLAAGKIGDVDTIYPIIIGGIISGACVGLLFRLNGSSGGTDIISKYASKVKPEWNFFWVIFVINAVIAIVSYFVYGQYDEESGTMVYSYQPVCMCLVYCFMSSFVGDHLISGSKQAYKFIIITDCADAIEQELLEKLHHSATRLQGEGSYTHKNKEVLVCLCNKHQLVDAELIVKKYPDAFAFVERVDQTFGQFRRVK